MTNLLKNIIRFVLFIALQVFLFNKVPPVHQFVKPYIYFLFILWLPFNIGRAPLMLVAFIFGLTFDYFSGTPGLHTAPCVLTAYLRPVLIKPVNTAGNNTTKFCRAICQKHGLGFLCNLCAYTYIHAHFITCIY